MKRLYDQNPFGIQIINDPMYATRIETFISAMYLPPVPSRRCASPVLIGFHVSAFLCSARRPTGVPMKTGISRRGLHFLYLSVSLAWKAARFCRRQTRARRRQPLRNRADRLRSHPGLTPFSPGVASAATGTPPPPRYRWRRTPCRSASSRLCRAGSRRRRAPRRSRAG